MISQAAFKDNIFSISISRFENIFTIIHNKITDKNNLL